MGGVLFEGGCVLSLDRRAGNLARADVHVDDGRVAAVGPDLRVRGAERVDAEGAIVLPGFVDAHRHAWRTLLRNLAVTGGASSAAVLDRFGPAHGPDELYAATALGLLTAAAAGTTTVVDHADVVADDAHLDAVVQAHRDVGLRGVVVQAPPAWLALGDVPRLSWRRGTDGLTTFAVGAPDLTVAHVDRATEVVRAARDQGLRVHAHVSADPSDRGTVARFAARGLLGDDVTLTRCTHLADEDLDAVAATGTRVCLTATAEMALDLGPPPVQRLLDRSVRPGLGVEDELAGPGDVLTQMRATQSLQHATVFERKLAGKAGLPALLSTREVIRFATVDGAAAAGLDPSVGTLGAGQVADLVVLRTDRPNLAPVNDAVGAVVWGVDASNVDWVLVAGRPIVRDGVLQGDVGRVRALAEAARRRLGQATGELVAEGAAP